MSSHVMTDVVVSSPRARPPAEEAKIFLEPIEVKPSAELIRDEYFHKNSDVLVHLFHSPDNNDSYNVENLQHILNNEYGYDIPTETNIHNLNSIDLEETLKKIALNDGANKSALVMVFSALYKTEGSILSCNDERSTSINKIWGKFIAYNCPQLKDKPKIFIFQCTKLEVPIGRDSTLNGYQAPAEADVLVVYNKNEGDRKLFMDDLCDNLMQYGKYENLVTLVSMTRFDSTTRPLIISTLTKNFYLINHPHRGHFYELEANQLQVQELLKKIEEKVNKGPKAESQFFKAYRSLRKTFSMSSKHNGGNNSNIEEIQEVKSEAPRQSATTTAINRNKSLSKVSEKDKIKVPKVTRTRTTSTSTMTDSNPGISGAKTTLKDPKKTERRLSAARPRLNSLSPSLQRRRSDASAGKVAPAKAPWKI